MSGPDYGTFAADLARRHLVAQPFLITEVYLLWQDTAVLGVFAELTMAERVAERIPGDTRIEKRWIG